MSGFAPVDIRVLSPHLDDAALSCGGAIAEWTDRGLEVEALTLFAGDEPSGEPASALVAQLHRVFGLAEGIVAARRREDVDAVSHLGARPVHAPFLEAIYRTGSGGEALYPDLPSLFGKIASGDSATLDRLVRYLEGLPPARRWIVPLGVGHHVDHQVVRRAAERAAPTCGVDLAYYEDVPYVTRWRALSRVLANRHGWEAESVEVSDACLERKLAALTAYRSQVRPLFGSERAMFRKLRRFHRRRGRGERLWRRKAPGPVPAKTP